MISQIDFEAILKDVKHLQRNDLNGILKDYKFEADEIENVLKMYPIEFYEFHKAHNDLHSISAPYEIKVELDLSDILKNKFTLVDNYHDFDFITGEQSERVFEPVESLVDVFSQIIKENLIAHQERQKEGADVVPF